MKSWFTHKFLHFKFKIPHTICSRNVHWQNISRVYAWMEIIVKDISPFPLFSSYRFRIHCGRYFDEGMSQKDTSDDSKGPASTQKLNYLELIYILRAAIHSTKA